MFNKNKGREMKIVGGTYREKCLDPYWNNIFGSGLRAVEAIIKKNSNQNIEYYTCCDTKIKFTPVYIDLS